MPAWLPCCVGVCGSVYSRLTAGPPHALLFMVQSILGLPAPLLAPLQCLSPALGWRPASFATWMRPCRRCRRCGPSHLFVHPGCPGHGCLPPACTCARPQCLCTAAVGSGMPYTAIRLSQGTGPLEQAWHSLYSVLAVVLGYAAATAVCPKRLPPPPPAPPPAMCAAVPHCHPANPPAKPCVQAAAAGGLCRLSIPAVCRPDRRVWTSELRAGADIRGAGECGWRSRWLVGTAVVHAAALSRHHDALLIHNTSCLLSALQLVLEMLESNVKRGRCAGTHRC